LTPRLQLRLDVAGAKCLLSPDGSRFVTTYYHDLEGEGLTGPRVGSRKAALVEFDAGTVVRRYDPAMEWQEYLIAYSPDGRRFLSGRKDGVLRLWDVATGRIVRTIQGPAGVDVPGQKERTIYARAVAFLPNGIRVASGGHHGWNEVDPATNRIVPDPVTGRVLRVEPLQVWDAELDWAR
jgi:WD40 repeat protein